MCIQIKIVSRIASILVMSAVACMAAAADTNTVAATTSADVLDEVVVSGTRVREMREAVIKAEDRVVARYNELNQVDDLDIRCLKYTPTGTRLSYRFCLTRLQERAQQTDATQFMTYMRNSDVSNGEAPPNRETGVRLMERLDDYRKNMEQLLQDNPDLRELVAQQAEALRRYEAAQRMRLKGKPPPAE